jgi:hypothetical protein
MDVFWGANSTSNPTLKKKLWKKEERSLYIVQFSSIKSAKKKKKKKKKKTV